ncbi:MAG: hypothetical protein DME05_27005 [Candidatus Rokuibacteriota bacterium]|nr:MAG: hypothetical protein DME05_27005 [Candidatus Rokubacteria bacterium]
MRTAAIAFEGTSNSTTTGPFTDDAYFAGNSVLMSMTLPFTTKVGSSEHHSKPASALPADTIVMSSAKTNRYARRRITSTPSDLPTSTLVSGCESPFPRARVVSPP